MDIKKIGHGAQDFTKQFILRIKRDVIGKNYKIVVNYLMIGVIAYTAGDIASLFYDDLLQGSKTTKSKKTKKGGSGKGGLDDDLSSFGSGRRDDSEGFDSYGTGGYTPSKTLDTYNPIFMRNIFNSKGIIPDADVDFATANMSSPAVRTSAPIQLIGTIIFDDEKRSLAAIQDRNANELFPVRIGNQLGNYGKITKIEKLKVTFFNTQSQRNEYVEITEQNPGIELRALTKAIAGNKSGVHADENHFTLERSTLDGALKNINQVLTESRMIPDPNGGWKLIEIVPGSLFDTIGLKNDDNLCGINGQDIDVSRALEFLNELKNANHIDLCIKRNGKQMNHTYDIK